MNIEEITLAAYEDWKFMIENKLSELRALYYVLEGKYPSSRAILEEKKQKYIDLFLYDYIKNSFIIHFRSWAQVRVNRGRPVRMWRF